MRQVDPEKEHGNNTGEHHQFDHSADLMKIFCRIGPVQLAQYPYQWKNDE